MPPMPLMTLYALTILKTVPAAITPVSYTHLHLPHDGVNGLRLLLLFVQTENTLSGSYHPDLTIMQFLHLLEYLRDNYLELYAEQNG